MRGSSRSHRIIIETQVIQKSIQKHLSRFRKKGRMTRARTTYTYHLSILPKPVLGGASLPSMIQADSNLYSKVIVNKKIVIAVGPGRFHFPWYRSIKLK